jgi:DNA adenine methylase
LLGDFNPDLINFYDVVKDKPVALHKAVNRFPIGEEFYYQLRDRAAKRRSKTSSAARFLYLNRFCFNGVYRTNKSGHFNVPFGCKTGALPTRENLVAASELFCSAEFVCADFSEVISRVKRGDFVYLDPPYTADRYRGEYGYGAFSSVDLARLVNAAEYIDARGAAFLISYKYDPVVKLSFSRWFQSTVLVRRHVAGFAGSRGMVAELLISNRPFKEARS